MKWKDRLLSSSLPLEFEVGKILAKDNFSVDFDYSYKRYDNKDEKEFSIDVKASGYYPFEMDSEIELSVDLLLECKYRNPNVSWLFIEDFNIEEYSNFSSKGVVKVIDEFSEIFSKNSFSGSPYCPTCLKGMEVNTQNGEVHDKGIIHGTNQLLYSIPSLIESHISSSLTGRLDDIYPYLVCPILITTADLRLIKNDFSIKKLEQTKNLDDISTEVPFLKVYSDVYPGFKEHCVNIFKEIPTEKELDNYNYFKKLRQIPRNGKGHPNINKMYSRPDDLLIQLRNGIGNDLFREVLVCNLKNFPALLKEIKNGIELIANGFEKIENCS